MASEHRFAILLVVACSLSACARDKGVPAGAPAGTPSKDSSVIDAAPASVPSQPAAQAVVSGAGALQFVKDIVACGPRFVGSPGHARAETYLRSHLKGIELQEDAFTIKSPEGEFPGRNFIAKFPGKKDGVVVIAGHYDTPYPLRKSGFVGANDGGSGTGLLLELAQHLRKTQLEGYSVWLVWTDGEEAVRAWTSDQDSVYGSRHLAETWEKDGTLKRLKAFLLADMIGDSDLNVERDANSTLWVEDLVLESATRLGYQSHFFARTTGMDDDHTPFSKRGVPVADLIDFDYGYSNVFWHTPNDTLDKLSPRSLEIVGNVLLDVVRLIGERK